MRTYRISGPGWSAEIWGARLAFDIFAESGTLIECRDGDGYFPVHEGVLFRDAHGGVTPAEMRALRACAAARELDAERCLLVVVP